MKNTQLYPFERNKYYYGMLLSVENFNAEQKYFNDKRRLLNRLLYGSGVVCGLNVVGIDEQTVSVESGLALDSTGREIVNPSPVTKKLSMIDGYQSAMNSGGSAYVYLCAEYSEDEKGQSYDLVNPNASSTPDKLREGCHLYLTSAEPEDTIDPVASLYENTTTVFSSDKLRIRQIVPRFVNPLSVFELRVEIETFTQQFVSFSYDLQLICMTGEKDEGSVLTVRFNERLQEKTGKYTLVYQLKPNNVNDTQAIAGVDPSTFSLSFDGSAVEGSISGKSETTVIDGDVREAVFRSSFDRDMDTLLREGLARRLYLARIDLLFTEETAVIEQIHPVPFRQYVINNPLQQALQQNLRAGSSSEEDAAKGKQETEGEVSRANDKLVTSGIARLDLSAGSLKNKVFYSEEIIHGLGLGSVSIVLGLNGKEDKVVYGDAEIFKEDVPQVKLAAKLFPEKGSFVVGLMSLATVLDDYVEVKWTAIRDVDETVNDKKEMKILIRPSSLVLKPGASKYLDAVCLNMANKTLRWSVEPETGGNIDANALYTAPMQEGVYEIIAQSAAYSDIKASIMVVVRK